MSSVQHKSKPKYKPRGYIRRRDFTFVDADPVVYQTRGAWDENGKPKYNQIAQDANLSYQTVRRLLDGDTRRPVHATVTAVFAALGYTVSANKPGFAARLIEPLDRTKAKKRARAKPSTKKRLRR